MRRTITSTPLETILIYVLGFCLAAIIVSAQTWAIVLAWNYALAKPLQWPPAHFWQVFSIMFLIGLVRRIVR